MFGYRVRYLGPEEDEAEDMCFAYRGPVQKGEDQNDNNYERKKPPNIMSPKICEVAVSPKVASSTTTASSMNQSHKLPSSINAANALKTINHNKRP